jgi:NADPH-dependent ferric siderophore reductase
MSEALVQPRTLQRIRHNTRMRLLHVVDVVDITPRMRRVALRGDMEGFASPGFGDHIKCFFTEPGVEPVLPGFGPNGAIWPEGMRRPEGRDYTPRYFDAAAGTLVLDFVLHGDGPASSWAQQVAHGQKLLIGGPRGSLVVPPDFGLHFLAADETGLPAVFRRIEELPSGTKVVAVIEVADKGEEQPVTTAADLELHWVHRDGAPAGTTTKLIDRVRALALPDAALAYGFIAAEAGMSRSVGRHLIDEGGFNPEWVKAAGYWLLGVADANEPH